MLFRHKFCFFFQDGAGTPWAQMMDKAFYKVAFLGMAQTLLAAHAIGVRVLEPEFQHGSVLLPC